MIDTYVQNLKLFLENKTPETLIILGSGLGSLASELTDVRQISYLNLGFPASTVAGHAGILFSGKLSGKEVLCMQGRFHLYEGHRPQIIKEIMCAFSRIGIKNLIVTNAAGSLKRDMPAGSLMMISDHINFSGQNPLIGPNNDSDGPRFVDMSNAYDANRRQKIRSLAKKNGILLYEGVYLMVLGPNFETAAEIRAFQALGADAVGMSTVPEVLAAVYAGLSVVGFSVITNLGTGLQTQAQSHTETLEQAAEASKNLARLVMLYLKED
jgi:xanthosine phosphorylase